MLWVNIMESSSKENKVSNPYSNDPRSIELRNWCNANLGRGRRLEERVLGFNGISHYKYGKNKINDSMWESFSKEMKNIECYERKNGVKLRPNQRDSTYLHSLNPVIFCEAKNHLSRKDNLKKFNEFANSSISIDKINEHRDFIIEVYPLYKKEFFELDGETTVDPEKVMTELEEWYSSSEETKKVKQRLANFVYGYNYRNSDTQFTGAFSTLVSNIKSGKRIRVSTYDKIKKVMNKVDSMIDSNHAFAIAARKL